ncbi:MAG: hypothetical protein N2D54_04015, partial [Chloroflexota bacterium]
MARLEKVLLVGVIFVMIFSAGGSGAVAAPAESPQNVVFKTGQFTLPHEFMSGNSNHAYNIPGGLGGKHFFEGTAVAITYQFAPLHIPVGKVVKWVKLLVVDQKATKAVCLSVFQGDPNNKTSSYLGSLKCTVDVNDGPALQKIKVGSLGGVTHSKLKPVYAGLLMTGDDIDLYAIQAAYVP